VARPLPPLQSIQAFLVATRASSFRAAADELSLTPSAFSRRIQALERFLGVALYDRSGSTPRLTDVGARYCRELEPAIEAICASTHALRSAPQLGRLRLMCPGSFAIHWLMPRLRDYYEHHGGQEVDLVVTRDLDTLRLGRADVGIASGPRDFEGLHAEPFLSLKGAVVAAPKLAGGRAAPRSADELHTHRLLGLAPPADLPRDLWTGWQTTAEYRGPSLPEPIRFDTWSLMYEAAANGMGVTIAVPAVSETYLRDGRLRPCFGGCIDLSVRYELLYVSDAVKRRNDVRRLVAWLRQQMDASVEMYSSLVS
jgi:LysR family glycine cleavage system transcriptional activator